MKELPVGIQTFDKIINKNMIYVDKTGLIYELAQEDYLFLSRPRRFGKSLLISTLQAYFEGKKELFKGLKIEQLETEWTEYPVVNLSFAKCKSDRLDVIVKFISIALSELEAQFGIIDKSEQPDDDRQPNINFNARYERIIKTAHAKTGRQVVLLIDEYDTLMLNTITDTNTQDAVRTHMNNLFSPIKDLDPILKFVFITGITKFSQMSIFSTLNNLTDISLYEKYSTLCGFTENEIRTTLKPHVEALADKLHCSFDEAIAKLKVRYDGYKFSDGETGVFNPYSVLRALDSRIFKNYWVETATPSSLIALLRQGKSLKIDELEDIYMSSGRFDTPIERVTDIVPFLYQSGYLSIKSYDPDFDQYIIGFPNKEVRYGFSESLIKNYIEEDIGFNNDIFRRSVVTAIKEDNPEILLTHLQDFLRKIPYPDADPDKYPEWYYQNLLYAILATCGLNIQTEIRTSDGRIDFVVFSPKSIFIFEFKLNKSAEEALSQIDEKEYAQKFSFENRKIWKIGVNFSSEKRTVDEWKIAK
ncbi:MAG: ATP-binding protein [Bacteroidales bacterium]|nr:ATP-binding protein [Bacteroidales bacterium]